MARPPVATASLPAAVAACIAFCSAADEAAAILAVAGGAEGPLELHCDDLSRLWRASRGPVPAGSSIELSMELLEAAAIKLAGVVGFAGLETPPSELLRFAKLSPSICPNPLSL